MRTLLVWLVILASPLAAGPKKPAGDAPKKKRVLFITESKGFVHGVVNRGKAKLAVGGLVVAQEDGPRLTAVDNLSAPLFDPPHPDHAHLYRRHGLCRSDDVGRRP